MSHDCIHPTQLSSCVMPGASVTVWYRRHGDTRPTSPVVYFWLHHTAHLQVDSASAERGGQWEVSGITRKVTCT